MTEKLFAACVLIALAAPAHAETYGNFCQGNHISFCDGCVLDHQIVVRPGSTCVFRWETSGKFLGHDFTLRPKLGKVGNANGFTSGYAAPAAPGEDYYEEVIRYQKGLANMSVTIRNHVKIDPGAR